MAGIFPDKVLEFKNSSPIKISYKRARTYAKCRSCDSKLMAQGFVWHEIRVIHNGKVRGLGKNAVLDAIFNAIDDAELYPVAYRRGDQVDNFLVRQCDAALQKLFNHELCIRLSNGQSVFVEVSFNVGEYKFGQIAPQKKIAEVLNSLYSSMVSLNGVSGILNLADFQSHPEFEEVYINLNNSTILERVCKAIYRNDDKFRTLSGLILCNNRISALTPMAVFNGVQFAVLDLRNNELRSSSQLCRDLHLIKAKELYLKGNPVTKSSHYPACLQPILKNFQFIDGISAKDTSTEYTPLNTDLKFECVGHRIDCSNKGDMERFQSSDDWHAILIPDANWEFTKDEIIDFFFITISQDMGDFYPCYYKYVNQEHRFLVRNCFDQLKHLLSNCNLELHIPRIDQPATNDALNTVVDLTACLKIDRTIPYYLLMSITPFQQGQVDPVICIEKALDRRFSCADRLLDMENFQSCEGLENIMVNLSSPSVLRRVLLQASRKFLSSCIELRLRQNKIMKIDCAKALALMDGLRSVDLADNWLYDLADIKDLQMLSLKTLNLDGNPLCSRYSFASEYIKAVRQYFPELRKLDNIEIAGRNSLSYQKNYLCDTKRFDFVDDFVKRYFYTFESEHRLMLINLYHPQALFTMSFRYRASQADKYVYQRMARYSTSSRNIFKMPDYARTSGGIHMGPHEIMDALMALPKMTHDINGLNTDTIVSTEKMVLITVHGVFQDQMDLEADITLAFTRSFVLMPVRWGLGPLGCAIDYKIVNEQLSVFNPTPLQTKNAFRICSTPHENMHSKVTVTEKEALLIIFKEITHLKSVWCTRCLEDGLWDLEKALDIFGELCRQKELPDTAFQI